MRDGMIGRTIEHYRIDLMLGQGGMAVVYRATDLRLQRQVAIKIMHAHLAAHGSFQQRFLQEARSSARLDHPNIIRVLTFNNLSGDLFLVMELIPGGSMRQYTKRLSEESRFIDYPEAIEVTRQLADALDYAHSQGMVHRDVKPDNVLLKPEGNALRLSYRPILTDFGLAKLTSSSADDVTDQQPVGTYPYMSPEQCLAEKLDHRSDIYSLGIMLYELSVGRLPFNPKSIAEAARMHGREPVPLPTALRPGYPVELERIVLRCLAKAPDQRYAKASDLALELQTLLRPLMSMPVPVERSQPLPTPSPFQSADDGFPTDIVTTIREQQLPAGLPNGYPVPEADTVYDQLVFHSPEQPIIIAKISESTIRIGSDPTNTVVLRGGIASRTHAQVERKPNGKYYILDLHSTNGTWVDGYRLEPEVPVLLIPGAIVRMGNYWMQLGLKRIVLDAQMPDLQLPIEDEEVELSFRVPNLNELFKEDAFDTDVSAFVDADPPRYTPPHMTLDQMGFDRLVLFSESEHVFTVKLEREYLDIGRSGRSAIMLEGRDISRVHARMERAIDGKYFIEDAGSKNGVWVDGKRLLPGETIHMEPEKTIRIGSYWVKYELKRVLPLSLMADIPTLKPGQDSAEDPNATVIMIKPLEDEMPVYSQPPLTVDLQSNDHFVFYSEDHPMKVIKLASELIRVGRGEGQDIQLDGKRVSRAHAEIQLQRDGTMYISDLGSANGTWVKDTLLVPQTKVLWNTDEIVRLGNYWVKFERGNQVFDIVSVGTNKDSRGLVGKRIKNFRIDRFIGQNSLSAVYKATELTLDRVVALKIMHPNLAADETYKQRFLRDARTLSRLEHPNIVRILSYDNSDNELFMVMEMVAGNSLRAYLNQLRSANKVMSLSEAVSLTIQLADGLNYAHQQGMIHRSLTPMNVVLRSTAVIGPIVNYVPVMTEFTVTQSTEQSENHISERSDINYPYASPEEFLGERVDSRSDIYELGVLFYEMLIGSPPFRPRSMSEAIRMHAREPIPLPSVTRGDIPEEIETVLLKMLAKTPSDRFRTAIEVARALQRTKLGAALDSNRPEGTAPLVDNAVTVFMNAPLPAEMPQPTRAPSPHAEHDQLIFYSDEMPTQVVVVDRKVLTVGRTEGQDIVLGDQRVSRQHVRIEVGLAGAYRVLDQGSKNGTFLGSYRLINGVAEIWNPSETLRVGGYWVRIEQPGRIAEVVPVPNGNGAAEPTFEYPPLAFEKIQINIDVLHLRVTPGTMAAMQIEIVNRSDVVDHFRVELSGLPTPWASVPAEALFLLPNTHDTASITFHPPMSSSSAAGEHAFEVRVIARAQGISSAAVQGVLEIGPFYSFVIDMEPERITSGRRVQVTINNSANTFGKYTLQARDREQALSFDLSTKQYTLAPGQSEVVSARVISKRRHLLGAPKMYPFEITVIPTPAEAYGGTQSESGELKVAALIPGWLLGGCLLLILLIAVLGVVIFTQLSQMNAQNEADTRTAVAQVATADFAATATADAAFDGDGDGLSNQRELTLGTFNNVADSDEDGLSDGVEVLVWRTNPLNPDSDGDGVNDGTEVANGTDALVRDTDQDGVPDNLDAVPLLPPTPTITPFPTIPGTNGDICTGSPVPSRLAIGDEGVVSANGPPNRVRSAPSKADDVVALMRTGETFVVVGGPTCDTVDQIRWWQIQYGGLVGWTAEGEGANYYLDPPADDAGAGTSNNAFPFPANP